MLKFGFFNSLNHDRVYDAEDMSAIFNNIITDGVFDNYGKIFATRSGSNGLDIIVGSGRAWFDSTWTISDSDITLTVDAADVSLSRIDSVILEVDHSTGVRANSIKILKGTAGSTPVAPTLMHGPDVFQHALANITLAPGTTEITDSMIEVLVGRSGCPFVTSVLESVAIDDLFAKWENDFSTWFADLQAQLSGDIATNLQNQITALDQKVDENYSKSISEAKKVEDSVANQYGLTPGSTFNDVFSKIGESSYDKIGDVKESFRSSLGDDWAIPNGDFIDPEGNEELISIVDKDNINWAKYQSHTTTSANYGIKTSYDTVYTIRVSNRNIILQKYVKNILIEDAVTIAFPDNNAYTIVLPAIVYSKAYDKYIIISSGKDSSNNPLKTYVWISSSLTGPYTQISSNLPNGFIINNTRTFYELSDPQHTLIISGTTGKTSDSTMVYRTYRVSNLSATQMTCTHLYSANYSASGSPSLIGYTNGWYYRVTGFTKNATDPGIYLYRGTSVQNATTLVNKYSYYERILSTPSGGAFREANGILAFMPYLSYGSESGKHAETLYFYDGSTLLSSTSMSGMYNVGSFGTCYCSNGIWYIENVLSGGKSKIGTIDPSTSNSAKWFNELVPVANISNGFSGFAQVDMPNVSSLTIMTHHLPRITPRDDNVNIFMKVK